MRRHIGRHIVVLVAAVAAALTLAGSAGARTDTTTPGVLYVVHVRITNTKITFPKRDHVMPVGAEIRYSVYNAGTRTYVFGIWGAFTSPIKPHKSDSVFVVWRVRGDFLFETLYRGRRIVKGYLTVY